MPDPDLGDFRHCRQNLLRNKVLVALRVAELAGRHDGNHLTHVIVSFALVLTGHIGPCEERLRLFLLWLRLYRHGHIRIPRIYMYMRMYIYMCMRMYM